jgi:hypothetical protein
MYLGLVLLLVQQTATQAPSQVAKVDVVPAEAEVQIGQTLRLSAVARDSAGRPLQNVPIKWMGHGEGSVDSTGLLKAGYAGYVHVYALAAADSTKPILVRPRFACFRSRLAALRSSRHPRSWWWAPAWRSMALRSAPRETDVATR